MTGRPRAAPSWRRYLRFWGTDVAGDVRDELAFHLDMRARDFETRGMTPEEARRAARERFGDVQQVDAALRTHDRRRHRGERWRESVASFGRDLRQAIRIVRSAPGFAASAIICLALGIGATAAIFAVVDLLLLRPFPVARPANLVVLAGVNSDEDVPGTIGYQDYLHARDERQVFESLVAAALAPVSVRVGDRSERRVMEAVSDNYWAALGVRMVRGRAFTSEEARQRERLLVISSRSWQREFAGAPDVVGRVVSVNGIPMTIVGVASSEYMGLSWAIASDGWFPASVSRDLDPSAPDPLTTNYGAFKVLGRLRDGVTLATARQALTTLADGLRREFPVDDRGLRFVIERELRSRPDISVSEIVPRAALVFTLLTVLTLLIACANVASLMLARVSGRQTEVALRLALGARRSRVVRQLLTESLVIAVLGAAAGVAIALGVAHWISSVPFESGLPVQFDVSIDWRVLALTGGMAVTAAVASGLGPALRASGTQVDQALKEGARGARGGVARQRFRAALVTAQIAVSFLLLVTAGLFVRSVQRAGHIDLGFRQDHEFLATVDVSLARYDSAQGRRFFRNLVEQAGELPGVRAAALAHTVPLGSNHVDFDIYADLPALEKDKGHTTVEAEIVTPRYFEAMGIKLIRGRVFSMRDDSAAPRVMVINSSMASRLWPGRNAVGQQVRLAPDGPPVTVVGIVATVTSIVLGERPRVIAYMPFAQQYRSEMTLDLLTETDPQAFAAPVRTLIASLDGNVAPYDMTTMATHLHDGIAFLPMRLGAILATAIGLLGLVLAVVGLYGVVAYSVAQRRREIGIRMAMGATAPDVVWSVLREGMIMTAIGLTAGCVIAIATTQILSNLLIDVDTRDPVTFLALAAVLAAATLTACLVPAWRAARIAPAGAIRD